MKYDSLKLLCNILLVTGIGTLFLATSTSGVFADNEFSYDYGSPWAGDGGPPQPNENEFSYDYGSPWAGDGGPPQPNENEFSYDYGSPWAGDGFNCEVCDGTTE